jgi:phosphohistidine phosphatase SixA
MCAMVGMKRLAVVLVLLSAAGAARADEQVARAWEALRGDGYVALIRHASAPGAVGDPQGFTLGDCATQRNLSEKGRAEARALGEKFRARKVKVGKVISSQWCRCRQTAALMDIGPVEEAPTFNNAFVLSDARAALTAGAREVIAAWRGPGTLVVATHGQNILALLGFRPAEGEVIVLAPDGKAKDGMRVVGRIPPAS